MLLMMAVALFVIGYFFAAALGIHALAAADPEPLGASVGLWLFASVGFVLSLFSYTYSVARFRRSPGSLAAFFTAAFCAASLCAGLALVHVGVSQVLSFGLSALAVASVAFVAPLCSAA